MRRHRFRETPAGLAGLVVPKERVEEGLVFDDKLPVCIVNPQSAGGKTGKRWPRLRCELEQYLGEIDVVLTGGEGDAVSLARRAAQRNVKLIVVVGGDGTVNEVVNGVMRVPGRPEQLTLGILPAGTGSDLARSLGIPSNSSEALRIFSEGRQKVVDVGKIEFLALQAERSCRYFLNIASLGLEGIVDKKVREMSKFLSGKLAYLAASVAALATFRPKEVVLRSGDVEFRRTILNVSVANGRFFGGGMQIAPTASLDDGLFEVVVVRGAPLWRLAGALRSLYDGTIYETDRVEHYRLRSLEVRSANGQKVCLGIDGEPVGELPVRFSLVPGALRVLVSG